MDLITYALCRKLIKRSIESLGDVFTLKGNVDSVGNLPSTGNKTGDVYLVGPDLEGSYDEYYWTSEDEWEIMGTTGPGFEHAITEEAMYKGADGTGTIENPAQDTIMYVINNNIYNMNNIYEGYYYNNKFYQDAEHTTEISGQTEKFYIDLSTNKIYRWDGTEYIEVVGDSVILEIKEPNDSNLKENSINYYPSAYKPEYEQDPRFQYLLQNNKLFNATNGNGYTWEEYNNNFIWDDINQITSTIQNNIFANYDQGNLYNEMYDIKEYFIDDPEKLEQNWPAESGNIVLEGQWNYIYDIVEDGSQYSYKFLYYIDGKFYTCETAWIGSFETGKHLQITDCSEVDSTQVESGSRLEYLINHPEMLELSQQVNADTQEIIDEVRFKYLLKSWVEDINQNAFQSFSQSEIGIEFDEIINNGWNEENADLDLTYNNDNWNYFYNDKIIYLPYDNILYKIVFSDAEWSGDIIKIEPIVTSSDYSLLLFKKNNIVYNIGENYVNKTGDSMSGTLKIHNRYLDEGALDIGLDNTITARNSIAFGSGNKITQPNSMAAGFYSQANGINSLAWGNATKSDGNYSIAEGDHSIAKGANAHAEGKFSLALGTNAHAEGEGISNVSQTIKIKEDISGGKYWILEGQIDSNKNGYIWTDNKIDEIREIGTDIYEGQNTQYIELWTYGLGERYVEYIMDTGAIGKASHVEGYHTGATGNYSHAEGNSTIASGSQSHAEGWTTTASGTGAHAEGDYTIASGYISHAEGRGTVASGDNSHAEGYYAISAGSQTHAEGNYTVAYGESAHAECGGGTNWLTNTQLSGEANTKTYTISSTNRIYIGDIVVYNGIKGIITSLVKDTSITLHQTLSRNAPLENASVKIYWAGASMGRMSHTEGCITKALGYADHAEGCYTTASGEESHAEGYGSEATGKSSHAEGFYTTASGEDGAHSEGAGSVASGKTAHAEGYKTTASGDFSHAEGKFITASGDYSHAEGATYFEIHNATGAKNTTTYVLTGEVFVGQCIDYGFSLQSNILTASYDSTEDKTTVTVSKNLSYSAMNDIPVRVYWPNSHMASGNYSHAEGASTIASGLASHTEGYNTNATGNHAHAEGKQTIASGESSHAEGAFIDTNSGVRLIGEGGVTTYTIGSSMGPGIKVGDFINKDSNTQIKIIDIGTDTITLEQTLSDTAIDDKMYAVRCLSVASGDCSHAEGSGTFASGQISHAEGKQTTASGENSHAEGYGTIASNFYAHAEGRYTTALGINSHAEGYMTHAEGAISHAEGDHTRASGDYSHTEGQSTLTLGSKSHAEGHETIASGENSHAEGDRTVTFESDSHAEGIGSLALGVASHVEGGNSSAQTRTRNIISISSDRKVVVIQTEGVAEESFLGCSIYRDSSKAMVINEEPEILQDQSKNWTKRTLTFDKAIPETFSTYFSLYKLGNAAKGTGSHAEGWGTSAFGDNSHSEGLKTTARANYSHTEGSYTEAHGDNQHVEGKYNIPDETSLHIVGNGTYNSLSNAHTLASDGTAWFAGDIYTGSTSGTNKDSGSKKVATEEYVRNLLQEFATLNNLNMPD